MDNQSSSENQPMKSARPASKLSESVDQRLNMYVLAAGAAGVSLLACAQPAQAKIVYTPANKNIGSSTFIDLNHDGVRDFKLTLVRTQHCEGGCTTTARIHHGTAFESTNAALDVYGVAQANQVYGQGNSASALAAGVRVGPKSKFPGGKLMAHANAISGVSEGFSGAWAGTGVGIQRRYLGLKFEIHGKYHFGWARFNVTLSQGAVIQATLTGYAYETTADKPIVTGRTKGNESGVEASTAAFTTAGRKPASLGLLAIGSSGLSIWRREESATERN
jgi:hypothetical protein